MGHALPLQHPPLFAQLKATCNCPQAPLLSGMLAWAGAAARRPQDDGEQQAAARSGKGEHAGQQKVDKKREQPLSKQQRRQDGGPVAKHRRQPLGAQSVGALTALGTVAFYASLRGGITVFHHTRRRFLRQLLLDLSQALNELEQTWWLDFGSLLGIHRDGDLILHDNDVDVAVLQPDWEQLLAGLQRLLPQYRSRIVVPSDDPSTCFIRVYCPLGMADVFGAQPRGEDRILVDCGHGSCTEIDRAAVLPTGLMSWQDAKISAPGDVEAALMQRYGADWKVPRYMDKGADVVEGQKLYARIFRALSNLGIRL